MCHALPNRNASGGGGCGCCCRSLPNSCALLLGQTSKMQLQSLEEAAVLTCRLNQQKAW